MFAVFDHHFGEQLQSYGEGRALLGAEVQIVTRPNALDDLENIVVVGHLKTQRCFLDGVALAIAQGFNGNVKTVAGHQFFSCCVG